MQKVVIFDLDGVISSEQVYWDSAAVAVEYIRFGIIHHRPQLPAALIAHVKSRAVNSNWDLAYLAVCCYLLASNQVLDHFRCSNNSSNCGFEEIFQSVKDYREPCGEELIGLLSGNTKDVGVPFLQRIGLEVEKRINSHEGRFVFGGPEWRRVHDLCQRIHADKFQSGRESATEVPLVQLSALKYVLKHLIVDWDAELGVATGRTRAEADRVLEQFGLGEFFIPTRLVCYDDITAAEQTVEQQGGGFVSLAKPHPYSILRAVLPHAVQDSWMSKVQTSLRWAAYVGDGISDAIAAKAAGVTSIGVLTGIPEIGESRGARFRGLVAAGSDSIVSTVLNTPEALMSLDEWKVTM